MYFVYVLISRKDKKFYIGFSKDVDNRIKEHNSGKNPSTVGRRPLELIYYEAHQSEQDALKRERYFKTSKGRTVLKQILKDSLELYR